MYTGAILVPLIIGGALGMTPKQITQGMQMLAPEIAKSMENALIVACAVGLGVGVSVVPGVFESLPQTAENLFSNGIVTGSLTAIILNILFNMIGKKKTAS